MFSQLEYQTVILAALLHDIGKFLQYGSFEGLDTSGMHPKVSVNFISKFSDCFNKVADLSLLKTLVQRHYQSPNIPLEFALTEIGDDHFRQLAKLVRKADDLSSDEPEADLNVKQDHDVKPLMCVLERLNHESDDHLKLRFHPRVLLSAKHLSKENDAPGLIFPKAFRDYSTKELNEHIKNFYLEFSNLFKPQGKGRSPVDSTNFENLLAHLTNLLYRYTWCIPSNSQAKVPDISLFDHLKTTAAIVACLYRYHHETDSLNEKAILHPTYPRFCLAVGDLSGIQRYIFDIAQTPIVGGVARSLRARSLYVQLCGEAAAHLILHNVGLPMLNIVMNSGGKFYLLLPNVPKVITALEQAQKHIDDWFLDTLNGELVLNLAHATFDEADLRSDSAGIGGFGAMLRRISEKLDQRKQNCLLKSISQDRVWQEDKFFLGVPYGGQSPCHSCRKFPATRKSDAAMPENNLCVHCYRDRVIGSKLTSAKYLAFYAESTSGDIPVLGYSVAVESEINKLKPNPYLVLMLNDTDLADLTKYAAGAKYLATHVTQFRDCKHFSSGDSRHEYVDESNAPATFECIAHRSTGAELLGFLKADIDRLGETFVFGLKRKHDSIDTISRVATVSRLFDLFFSGWVEHLTSMDFRNCYTVFSGGDDLFIVGPWDQMPRLAERIRSDLEAFSGNPKGVTISAGVLLSKPSFPVARAASEVEVVLKHSKQGEKNQLTILGHTLPWADWKTVAQEWELLTKLTSSADGIASAFLYDLLRYAEMWREYWLWLQRKNGGNVLGLRYQPLLAYNIARNIDARKHDELYRWCEALLEFRPADVKQTAILNNLGLIASLLIYSRRGGKE